MAEKINKIVAISLRLPENLWLSLKKEALEKRTQLTPLIVSILESYKKKNKNS